MITITKRHHLFLLFIPLLMAGMLRMANGASIDSTHIVVDSGINPVGDPPRETSIGYNVHLSESLLARSTMVHLEFKAMEAELARVVVNGHRIQIPDSYHIQPSDLPELGATILSLPLAYFESGDNSIVFEAGRLYASPTNIYDNFTYGEVALIFSHLSIPVDHVACSKPRVDSAVDRGLFVWNRCAGDGNWVAIAVGGNRPTLTQFEGYIDAPGGIESLALLSFESADVFDTSNATRPVFSMQIWNIGSDRFSFYAPQGGCLVLDGTGGLQAYVGAGKTLASPNGINLQTGLACTP